MLKPYLLPMAALLLPASAMAQTPPPMSTTTTHALSVQDTNFIKTAYQAGLAEVQQAQLAEKNGDQAVQKLAQRLDTDHSTANAKLKSIASSLGASVPDSVNTKQNAQMQQLQGLKGAAFDSDYLQTQETAHKKAITLFENEAAQGNNVQLKTFAQQTLPVLRDHLHMIEQDRA